VEILGPVIVALWLVATIWRVRVIVEQIKREQREQPFGSKRWHWPAVVFLSFLIIVMTLLSQLVEDPR